MTALKTNTYKPTGTAGCLLSYATMNKLCSARHITVGDNTSVLCDGITSPNVQNRRVSRSRRSLSLVPAHQTGPDL